MTRLAVSIGAALLASSCVSFNYIRSHAGEPVAVEAYAPLEPRDATLGDCLTRLGAPDFVWSSEGGAINLAWAWLDTHDWGFSLSFSFDWFLSVEFELDSTDVAVQSVVLQFDDELVLERISRGFLWDLAPSAAAGSATSRALQRSAR